MTDLISIQDAAAQGIERLRRPIWATPEDHIKLDIIDGCPGPWIHLFAPFNKECNGRDPVNMLSLGHDLSIKEWEPYRGPLPESDEYKAAVARYEGCLSKQQA